MDSTPSLRRPFEYGIQGALWEDGVHGWLDQLAKGQAGRVVYLPFNIIPKLRESWEWGIRVGRLNKSVDIG